MAKKDKLDDVVFCDQCGGSLPTGVSPFIVKQPDGTTKSLCKECMWAAKADEDQPTVALDAGMVAAEEPMQIIHRPGDRPQPEAVVVAEEPTGVPEGPVAGGFALRHCKTFVCKTAPQALAFLDGHIAQFIKEHKIRVKHTNVCQGIGAIGSQGTREESLFITIWW